MNKLFTCLVLSLSASALAGGAGPRPALFTVGEIWQLTATNKSGLNVSAEMQLAGAIPKNSLNDTDIYATESVLGGGSIQFIPEERGIDATIVMDESNILRCFAQADESGQHASGYLLRGDSEATNSQLTEAQSGTNFSRKALLQGIERIGAGTCTLKRLH